VNEAPGALQSRFATKPAGASRALFGTPEKSVRNDGFFNSIRLRRVILLSNDIRLTPSYIALRATKEANRISLCGIAAISFFVISSVYVYR